MSFRVDIQLDAEYYSYVVVYDREISHLRKKAIIDKGLKPLQRQSF